MVLAIDRRRWPANVLLPMRRQRLEALLGDMQTELLDRRSWDTRAQLARATFEWIEVFYNQQRRHSTLGMLAPVTYATTRAAAPAA